MKTIYSMLKKERSRLVKIMEDAKNRLKGAPEGRLRIANKNNQMEFYLKSNSYESGRYLKKSERDIARAIAQKNYDECVVNRARERIKLIDMFTLKYQMTDIGSIHEKLNGYRKALIDVPVLSDQEYIRQWSNVQYEGKAFSDHAPEIITEGNERVRSKSEKIIADKLFGLGIAYRYEYPIVLNGNVRVYPDFTILKMPEREEVYLEHLGMMDDMEYINTFLYKLETYEKNGIYMGMNLFFTYETSKKPLNTRALDDFIRKVFVPE